MLAFVLLPPLLLLLLLLLNLLVPLLLSGSVEWWGSCDPVWPVVARESGLEPRLADTYPILFGSCPNNSSHTKSPSRRHRRGDTNVYPIRGIRPSPVAPLLPRQCDWN